MLCSVYQIRSYLIYHIYYTGKQLYAVRETRTIGKKDMIHNTAMPHITVDPETYRVTADNVHLTCEPSSFLPLSQRYYLF